MNDLIGRRLSIVLALAAFAATGCSAAPQEVGEGEAAESSAAVSFTGATLYDSAPTQCTVGGATMHCCPTGYAMVGAHLGNNVFKCKQLTSVNGPRFLDVGTVRNGMHACPFGSVMVGLHEAANYLACQYPGTAAWFEYVDGNPPTADSYPMHVCGGSSYAMSGIHAANNLFTCAF